MTYKIGLGLLLPDAGHNIVRASELIIAEETTNQRGLMHPPHITVKRPFELASWSALDTFVNQLQDVAYKAIDNIVYEGPTTFPDGTVYLKVSANQPLHDMHQNLLAFCAKFNAKPDHFEAENVLFHTTLALTLPHQQAQQALALTKDVPAAIGSFTSHQLGVFMWLPDNDTWIVIRVIDLLA